jgi:hypothetical protein
MRRGVALWRYWQLVWAVLGPILAVTSFVYAMWPQVTITTFPTLDPNDPLGTQFLISNNGRLPVRDLQFGCQVAAAQMWLQRITTADLQAVAELNPGQQVTRRCSVQATFTGNVEVNVVVGYRWPVIDRQEILPVHFSGRKGAQGYVLVPDITNALYGLSVTVPVEGKIGR